MRILRSWSILVLTLFCFGCDEIRVDGFGANLSGTGGEVSQGVGFTGVSTGVSTQTQTQSQTSTAGLGTAGVIAAIGLVALVLLADSKAICSGLGCGTSGGGGSIQLGG